MLFKLTKKLVLEEGLIPPLQVQACLSRSSILQDPEYAAPPHSPSLRQEEESSKTPKSRTTTSLRGWFASQHTW